MIRDAGAQDIVGAGLDISQTIAMWDVMEHVVRNHTTAWAGIFLNGQNVTDSDAVLAAVGMDHVGMISEVAQEVMGSGRVSVTEAKNSASESVPAS